VSCVARWRGSVSTAARAAIDRAASAKLRGLDERNERSSSSQPAASTAVHEGRSLLVDFTRISARHSTGVFSRPAANSSFGRSLAIPVFGRRADVHRDVDASSVEPLTNHRVPSKSALVTRMIALLRGINVGGANRVPMQALRALAEKLKFTDVSTYIASGHAQLTMYVLDAATSLGRLACTWSRIR
jgi:hypothetical protein